MVFSSAIQHFRRNYNGPKLNFLISGGGYSCLNFRQLPGASKILNQAIEPYSPLSFADFLNNYYEAGYFSENSNFCNEDILSPALTAMNSFASNADSFSVVVTAALTTNRYRQGENRAFIALEDGRKFKISLPKLDQNVHENLLISAPHLIDEQRLQEDVLVGQIVLAVIMNDPTMMPVLPQGSSFENLNPVTV